VTRAFWLMAAALPLAAQPKLLINAKVDTRSAAAGLEREFRTLLTAEPQPAWIGYTVPAAGGVQLGCDLVSGVIHLEPPDRAVILFRVEANAVSRIRTLSPECEIDAGGVPVHWLADVQPAEGVEVLKGLVTSGPSEPVRIHAVSALAVSKEGIPPLIEVARTTQNAGVRRQAMSSLGRSRDPRALAFFEDVLRH
jgi:HEAT repeats